MKEMKKMSEWYEDWNNITTLVRWLHDVEGVTDFEHLIYCLEKPWKYTEEYNKMMESEEE